MKKGAVDDGVLYHAGFPNAAEDQRSGGLSLDALAIQHRASTFFWRLEEAVPELSWPIGTIVVVDRALSPAAGGMVVAVADEAFVLCRLQKDGFRRLDGLSLDGEVALWGVVTYAVQPVRGS